jgi:AcrR family transcriptional regulator
MAKVIDKRSAILNTALDLLVEHGFHNTPMSLIAREAGVSAGIIYHYFESKEELILELYREVKQKIINLILEADFQKKNGLEALNHVWLNTYHYYASHPKETLFLEQFENSPYIKMCLNEFDAQLQPFFEWTEAEKRAGNIIDLPLEVMYELSIGVAVSLAKLQSSGVIQITDAILEEVNKAIFRSLQPARP